MIGCHDFCGHYEWSFAWLDGEGGHGLVRDYWNDAIQHDSQRHARDLIVARGFAGMKQYWDHALDQEAAGYSITATKEVFRIDMHECPSKGFLIRNNLVQYRDYCDHCMGWIGPLMREAGFVVNHEHNHLGQCWWEMRRREDAARPGEPGSLSGGQDVRLREDWKESRNLDVYRRSTDPDDKKSHGPDT